MKKYNAYLFLTVLLLTQSSCENKRDFCECMDIKTAITDAFELSKEEQELKAKECAWIDKEVSSVDQLQRMLDCGKK